jgi:hypothetical protein
LAESRGAIELLSRVLAPLDELGVAAEIRPQLEQLRQELERDEPAIEIAGDRRAQILETLLGEEGFSAVCVTVRARLGPEIGYRARWLDGRVEEAPPSRLRQLDDGLGAIENEIGAVTEEARELAEQLQGAGRLAAHARAQLAAAEAQWKAALARGPAKEPPPEVAPPLPPARASWWSWWTRFLALLVALFGRGRRSLSAPAAPRVATVSESPATEVPVMAAGPLRLPTSEPRGSGSQWMEPTSVGTFESQEVRLDASGAAAALERRVSDEQQLVQRAKEAEARLEMRLAENKARLVILGNDREERRRARKAQRCEHRARVLARLVEICRPDGAAEIDLVGPELPPGVQLVLSPGPRDPIDVRILLGEATFSDRRLTVVVPVGSSPDELYAQIEQLRQLQPIDVARRLAASLRRCRGNVVDFDRHARHAHLERERELTASRIDTTLFGDHMSRAGAELPREVERLLGESTRRWNQLLDEVERDWKQRTASCGGLEQLRAEVMAIEEGSAHRLSIARDELRDALTIELVRLVLQRMHPLRQLLHDRRIAVAREPGASPSLDETHDEIRIALPSAVKHALEALPVPELTALMSPPGLLSPFRTLAREKKGCIGRLETQLGEIRRVGNDALVGGLSIEPLVAGTLQRGAKELCAAHERWLDARLADEASAWQKLVQPLDLALELKPELERMAAALLGRVEAFRT